MNFSQERLVELLSVNGCRAVATALAHTLIQVEIKQHACIVGERQYIAISSQRYLERAEYLIVISREFAAD